MTAGLYLNRLNDSPLTTAGLKSPLKTSKLMNVMQEETSGSWSGLKGFSRAFEGLLGVDDGVLEVLEGNSCELLVTFQGFPGV